MLWLFFYQYVVYFKSYVCLEKSFDKKNFVVDEEHSNRSSHSPESGLGSTGHLAPGHSLLAGSQFQVCNLYNNLFF